MPRSRRSARSALPRARATTEQGAEPKADRSAQEPASGEPGLAQPRLVLRLELRDEAGTSIPRRLIQRVALRVLAAEGWREPLRLSVHLLNDDALRQANREQRGLDAPTDVLSFPLLPHLQAEGGGFALPPDEPRHLGDVMISFERAAAQAQEYGHSVEREVCYLLAHGVLHLLGYDHLEEDERRAMREREEAALQPLGLGR